MLLTRILLTYSTYSNLKEKNIGVIIYINNGIKYKFTRKYYR